MNYKVLTATLHSQTNYIPLVGDLGKSLPSGTKTMDNLEMSVSEVGLLVKYKHKGVAHTNLFPLAAVALMTLAND